MSIMPIDFNTINIEHTSAYSKAVLMRLWCVLPRWCRRRGKALMAAALTTSSGLCKVLEKTHTRQASHTPWCRRASSDRQSAWISGAAATHTTWCQFGFSPWKMSKLSQSNVKNVCKKYIIKIQFQKKHAAEEECDAGEILTITGAEFVG